LVALNVSGDAAIERVERLPQGNRTRVHRQANECAEQQVLDQVMPVCVGAQARDESFQRGATTFGEA
jgi:hypothetical protein